jgi:ankyrin repeat domain-containing protein 50
LFKGKDVAVACIFCNYNERSAQSLEELVVSILKQIIQNCASASESIKAFCEDFRDKQRRPRLTNHIDALRLEIQRYSKVFFVIDTLNKCLEDYQGGLIDELESISSTVYLMVTSRPLDLIKQRFQGACHLDINTTEEDVRKYIDS